jgi:CubicO group peptidase (beta-lactamase class C family)
MASVGAASSRAATTVPSRSPQVTTTPLVRPLALVLVTALGIAATARAEDPRPRFEEYMKACVDHDHFSGAVLVSKGGETLFAKGYGFANAEHQVPNTPRTKFRLGSITKQFTAMAILVLQERGKLKVEDPVGKYIDDAPKAWEGVTIHHLLSHTGGVPSYTDGLAYMAKMMMPETVNSMIARFRDKPLEFRPGEKFHYSNSGYFLLGAIIEKVSGQSYESFLKEAIFDPLGMKDTGYDHHATVIPGRAAGYNLNRNGLVNAPYLDMSQPYAAGSLYSTVEDLARWDRALNDGKLITKGSYAKMYAPVKNDYAYGWVVTTAKGRKTIQHGGGINGFVTEILRYPEEKVCVVVLCNVLPMNPGRVARDLASIALGEPFQMPGTRKVAKVDPKIYDACAGRYEIEPKVIATISHEGERLMIEVTDQPKIEMFPESDTVYFLKVVDATITFVKDDKGKVGHLVIHQGGRDVKAKRLEGEPPSKAKAGG